jgi:hypothetical protein
VKKYAKSRNFPKSVTFLNIFPKWNWKMFATVPTFRCYRAGKQSNPSGGTWKAVSFMRSGPKMRSRMNCRIDEALGFATHEVAIIAVPYSFTETACPVRQG